MMGHTCNAPVGPLRIADNPFATMTMKPSKERHTQHSSPNETMSAMTKHCSSYPMFARSRCLHAPSACTPQVIERSPKSLNAPTVCTVQMFARPQCSHTPMYARSQCLHAPNVCMLPISISYNTWRIYVYEHEYIIIYKNIRMCNI